MKSLNQTIALQFHLLGLSEDPDLQPVLFGLFLSVYLVTILGNLLIILAVSCDPHLHTPMYFFLSSLSFTDICISSTSVPKILVNIQTQDQSITYAACLSQIACVLAFAFVENFLLAVMAFDRYVAICHPLRYPVIMNPRHCTLFVVSSLSLSTVDSLLHTLMALRLSFDTALDIPHFFCELAQILKLSCSETLVDTILIHISASLFAGVPLCGIIFLYYCIVSSVLKMPSQVEKA
ncbi:olfactory receptor 7G2-like, partial [Ctenodactylus gundi]